MRKFLLFLFCVSLVCALQSVYAQQATEIDEIIVTATKHESTIQDVPFSVNVQSKAHIEAAGSSNIEELARSIVGLTVQNLGPGQSQVAIRGVSAGQIVRDQPGVKEQVGVYLDESLVSLSLFTPDLDLFDLNRVETLRGPQGTLFGSGSIGGTVRYITNQPQLNIYSASMDLDLHMVSEGGNGGHIKGLLNIPLNDSSAARLVGYSTSYAGFIDAHREGGSMSDDVNSGIRQGLRASVLWQVNDDLAITPRVVTQRISVDGFNRSEVFSIYANPYTTTRPMFQLGEREQYLLLNESMEDDLLLLDLNVTAEIAEMEFTSVTSVLSRDILVSRDSSTLTASISIDIGFPEEAITVPSNLRDTTHIDQLTQEFRLHSHSHEQTKSDWILGLFFATLDRDYAQRLPSPGFDRYVDLVLGEGTTAATKNGFDVVDSPFNSDLPYEIDQVALFGEFNYDVSDVLTITLGGRWYDVNEKRLISTGGVFGNGDLLVADKTASSGFTPRFLAIYQLTDRVNWNVQAARGFRLGGVNDPLNTIACTPGDLELFGGFQSYEDEFLWNYETGLKVDLEGGSWMNLAVFHAAIENLQVTLDAGSCSSRIAFNVPEAHASGVEFELNTLPHPNWAINLAVSRIVAEFDSTVTAESGDVLGGIAAGNRLASVPEFQFFGSTTYRMSNPYFSGGEMYLTFNIQHVGDRITQPSDQVQGAGAFVSNLPYGGATGMDVTNVDLLLNPYTFMNLRFTFTKDNWETTFYVQNLTDEFAYLSFDRERGGRARLAFRTNEPRKLGMVFRMKFD